MNWNKWMREIHRWLSMAFVAAVMATSVALAQKPPVVWMSYLPLLPLALLALTGLYLFFLPYVVRWRSGRQAGGQALTATAGERP